LQFWPETERRTWRLQAAWFAAFFRNDAITARKWFDAGRKGAASGDCHFSMAAAALAFVENRWADTTRLAANALEECDRVADRGDAKAIRDALLLLIKRVNA